MIKKKIYWQNNRWKWNNVKLKDKEKWKLTKITNFKMILMIKSKNQKIH